MSFGKRIAKIRKDLNLTQQDFAEKVEVHISNIKRYEKDITLPNIDILAKIAKAIGISCDELVFEDGDGIASAKIMDKELLKRFEKISTLREEERDAVKIMLDSIIFKNQVENISNQK